MAGSNALPCTIADVIDLTGIHVVRNTGTQLHCRCPFCNDSKAHLNVRLDKNVFRCNRCGRGGGVLQLYSAFYDVSLNSAYDELSKLFCSDLSVAQKRCGIQQRELISKAEMPIAMSSVRDNTYRNLLSLLSLGANHREALLKRGLSGEDVVKLGYRTTPAVRAAKIVTELVERGCLLEGVPGFYRDEETGCWKLDVRGSGIMIPDRNINGEIEAIQIRLDVVRRSKFLTLSSVDKYCGTSASCCPHFVGLTDTTEMVYVTEGVMKSDIAYCLSKEIGKPAAFVGLTGVSNFNQFQRALEELKMRGIMRISLAFDMDDLTNENVRAAKERVMTMGVNEGFEMIPIRWNSNYKGIDDFYAAYKRERDEQ